MGRRSKIDWDLVFGLFWLLAIVVAVPFFIWLRIWVPCEWMGWFPLKDVPVRCTVVAK